jgi:hypothetical protein
VPTFEVYTSWIRSAWDRVTGRATGQREWWSVIGSFGDDFFGDDTDECLALSEV